MFRKSRTNDRGNQAVFRAQPWHMPCSRTAGIRYSDEETAMKVPVVVLAACAAAVSASPSFADSKSEAKSQVEFGINVAQRGLWREAIYRWQKATELDPTYVAAYNDLAIAYEHEGQLDKARKAYEKAIELDPNNAQVRQNYELFKEINERTSSGKQPQ